MDKTNLKISEVWPVSTVIHPNGGIGISWVGDGWGDAVIWWDDDGKLHADTECLSSNEDKEFLVNILIQLADKIIVER